MSVRKAAMILHRCCWAVFVALVVVTAFTGSLDPYVLVFLPAVVALVIGIVVNRSGGADTAHPRPAVEVGTPVTGRWSALNSPADKVPSHGTHAYGQTYAIDVVAEPEGRDRPSFRWVWPVVRPNRDFPAFGSPLLAVADGTVVHASDGQRDHLSRNSGPALAYLMVIEAFIRDLAGPGGIYGNRVVLDLGDGTYAAYAHVQRGSLEVRAGDTVRAGQRIARCGNSGNSTEPHVHFQLMDHPDLDRARGIPFTWRGIGVPADGEVFVAGEAVSSDW
ncbi:M23 family metallopeptidase [Streptomyces atroolivaceus]|uniref:M23 family metallopeptidase n=1 Tax=Streptomyces atroolivaceus TaxID=66869 RepID=UPI00341E4B38